VIFFTTKLADAKMLELTVPIL